VPLPPEPAGAAPLPPPLAAAATPPLPFCGPEPVAAAQADAAAIVKTRTDRMNLGSRMVKLLGTTNENRDLRAA
jgi:hypothetical protein